MVNHRRVVAIVVGQQQQQLLLMLLLLLLQRTRPLSACGTRAMCKQENSCRSERTGAMYEDEVNDGQQSEREAEINHNDGQKKECCLCNK